MLHVNSNHSVEAQIRDAFSREVARRIGQNRWTFPNRCSAMVPAAANCVIKYHAKAEDYVRAQFVGLSRDFCLRTFNLAYPPFGCLLGPKAKLRYEKHMLTVDSFKPAAKEERDSSMINMVYQQVNAFRSNRAATNHEVLQLLVVSKSISLHTLAYLKVNKFIKKDITSSVLKFLYEEKGEGDIYERFDTAEKEVRGFLGLKNEG